MKRSEINRALRRMQQMTERCRFPLPDFCAFTPEEWQSKGHAYDEVRDNLLGWDIINRGGGAVLIRVFNSLADEEIDRESPVTVHCDGCERTVPAGTRIRLAPGQSISIHPGLYHDFSVEPGGGPVLLGEVSQCNDDEHDNRFNPPVGRFPTIEEDEPPYRLLCTEYPPADA